MGSKLCHSVRAIRELTLVVCFTVCGQAFRSCGGKAPSVTETVGDSDVSNSDA